MRLLSSHPEFTLTEVVSASHAGQPLSKLWPNLAASSLVARPDASGLDVDVAFCAEPAGESMKQVPALLESGCKVVDLGPDYRLRDPAAFAATYGQPHRDTAHLGEAVYGLPELFHDQIRSARLIANPGCYPTATLLALAPLLAAHQLDGPVIVDAKSGTSGAGSGLSADTHHPEAALTVHPYGTPHHRHVPEMKAAMAAYAGASPALVFVPHLVPMVRGILCSIYPTPAATADPEGWPALFEAAYGPSPFVRCGGTPRLSWAQGTNRCFLSVQRAGDAPILFSALDNLGKGGAAQAIQNANLMFGFDETAGLSHAGFGV